MPVSDGPRSINWLSGMKADRSRKASHQHGKDSIEAEETAGATLAIKAVLATGPTTTFGFLLLCQGKS